MFLFCFVSGMLDKNSLNRCASVSRHWAMLVQQVKMDLSMHTFIQGHITFLQVLPIWEGLIWRLASFPCWTWPDLGPFWSIP